jgi:hypothetical protein
VERVQPYGSGSGAQGRACQAAQKLPPAPTRRTRTATKPTFHMLRRTEQRTRPGVVGVATGYVAGPPTFRQIEKKAPDRRGHAREDNHKPGRKGNAIEMARDGDPRPALVLALHDKPQVARQFAIGAAKSGLKNAKADRFQSILFDPAYLIRQDGARA